MRLKQWLESTPVAKLNLRDPATIAETSTVREAVQSMRDARLGCIVAINRENKPTGIFTEAMLRSRLNDSPGVLDNTVAEEMVKRLPWVSPSDEVQMVMDAMGANNMRFIVVVDDAKQVVGITGQKSLMEFVAECYPQEVFTQNVSSRPQTFRREGA